jgi:hypothetical protein
MPKLYANRPYMTRKKPDPVKSQTGKNAVILDSRNLYDPVLVLVRGMGFGYWAVGGGLPSDQDKLLRICNELGDQCDEFSNRGLFNFKVSLVLSQIAFLVGGIQHPPGATPRSVRWKVVARPG